MRRRLSQSPPVSSTCTSVGSPARSEPTSARAPQNKRAVGSTLCAAHSGVRDERRDTAELDGPSYSAWQFQSAAPSGSAERRRSRTDRAVGYTTALVLKTRSGFGENPHES